MCRRAHRPRHQPSSRLVLSASRSPDAARFRPMRALNILVVVMGVMIVVGFAALIAGIASKMSRDRPGTSAERPFATTAVDIPRGARIEAMTAAPNRLILELALPAGERQLVVIDLATGARLGTIALRPAQ